MIRDKNNMSYKYFLMLQETERSRIAEDLHDTTVQELVALSQKLDLANLYFDKDVTQARLELISAKSKLKISLRISEIRFMISDQCLLMILVGMHLLKDYIEMLTRKVI